MLRIKLTPKLIGGFYLLLVIFFGFIYWAFPSFWESPLGFIESMYFSVVTITTLGYGEITPANDLARVITALEALSGIFVIGLFLNSVAHRYSERQEEKNREQEDERWRPARLIVARHICRVHQTLFNSLRWVIKHDHHMDLGAHGFPPGFTQRQADAWGKEVQIKPLDGCYEQLKKMVEYNNSALDSFLLPKTMVYVVAAQEALSTCKFIASAYAGIAQDDLNKEKRQWNCSFNYQALTEMESIYKTMIEHFPEISELEKPVGPAPISADELFRLVELSNMNCDFLKITISK
jgi:hypothetical protein